METVVSLTMNPAIDKSATAELIAPEIKLRCFDVRRDPGGGGINVSRVIKRLKGESIAIFPSGGMTGKLLEQLLDGEGITHQPIPIQAMTRENFTAYDEVTEVQYRFGMPGAELTADEAQACLASLSDVDGQPAFVVMSGSLPPGVEPDFTRQVAERVTEMGAKLVIDTSGEALTAALEVGAYLIKPNIRELRLLVDAKLRTEREQEEASRDLIKQGKAEVVVVSLGAAGAMLVTADLTKRMRAPVVAIQSKVGAGDSMLGGIVLKLAQGEDIVEAVRYGIAAGAAAVMTPGTQLCHYDDVEQLYREISR